MSTSFTLPQRPIPAPRCYWMVDDQLLAGAHPGAPNRGDHRRRIDALYDAGVRTIVNLQEPGDLAFGEPFRPYFDGFWRRARGEGDAVALH